MQNHFVRVCFFFLTVGVWLCINHPALAVTGDLDSADAHFHRGEAALVLGNYLVAMQEYSSVLQVIRTLDIDLREWFQGNASIGLAYCSAATSDTAGTRRWIDEALSHHYWVFGALHTQPLLEKIVGTYYLDSICNFWNRERDEKRMNWRIWDPFVFHPNQCGPQQHHSTIIALHGGYGNLKEFSRHWQDVADSLCTLVIVPPGTDRVSPVGFSWDFDIAPIDSAFHELLNRPAMRELIDTQHLYIAGFSQGGHAAMELAMRHPDLIRGAVVIEGFDQEPVDSTRIDAMRSWGTSIVGMYGSLGYKPFIESFKNFKETCEVAGIPVRMEIIDGMVHELPADLPARMKQALEWIDLNTSTSTSRHADTHAR